MENNKKKKKEESSGTPTIIDLPFDCLREIFSFLKLKDQFNFMLTEKANIYESSKIGTEIGNLISMSESYKKFQNKELVKKLPFFPKTILLRLIVGDYWQDGHKIHKSYFYKSNFDRERVYEAYDEGTKIIGINFLKKACCDWDSRTTYMPVELVNSLKEAKVEIPLELLGLKPKRKADSRSISDGFALLFPRIVKLGDATFDFEELDIPDCNLSAHVVFGKRRKTKSKSFLNRRNKQKEIEDEFKFTSLILGGYAAMNRYF